MKAEALLKLAESLEQTARELRELAAQPESLGQDTSWRSISIISLTGRVSASRYLAEHGYRTLGDIDGKSKHDLMDCPNVGIKLVETLQAELQKYGAGLVDVVLK